MSVRLKGSTLFAGLGAASALALGVALLDAPARSADTVYGTAVPAAEAHLAHAGGRSAQAVLAGGC
ncbi:MAG TPA: hypothetical protein VFJ08_10855, partial [Salinisphaera sp.]